MDLSFGNTPESSEDLACISDGSSVLLHCVHAFGKWTKMGANVTCDIGVQRSVEIFVVY